jgi:hypothetical protein
MTIRVTLPADVHQIDETGFVWTFLAEAEDSARVIVDHVIVAGDADEPFMARVVDISESSSGRMIVHLDVIGEPAQLIGKLRHAKVLPA